MKPSLSAAALITAPFAALIAVAAMSPVTADTNGGGAVDKKALFTEKCSACHNLPNPTELSYTRAEWRRTVNTMLTKYKASDEISATEADEIVDYLATFAPHTDNRAPSGNRQWDSEADDVWFSAPNRTVIDNFESKTGLSGLSQLTDGVGKPTWTAVVDADDADGTAARVTGAHGHGSALLVDHRTSGADIDVKVRFKIVAGKETPAVGIAVGVEGPTRYDLVRYDQKANQLVLTTVDGANRADVQSTAINRDGGGDATQAVSLETGPTHWHTLRVQVRGGHVRGWIDSYKRINTSLPNYAAGSVALWSQGDTVADFDDWSTDLYDPVTPATS